MPGFPVVCDDTMRTTTEMPSVEEPQHLGVAKVLWHGAGWLIVPNTCKVLVTPVSEGTTHYQHMAKFVAVLQRSRGVTVSTLDPESSDRGSNPRETSCMHSCRLCMQCQHHLHPDTLTPFIASSQGVAMSNTSSQNELQNMITRTRGLQANGLVV